MFYTFIQVIDLILTIIPYAYLCYAPFFNTLKLPIKKLILIISLFVLVHIACSLFYIKVFDLSIQTLCAKVHYLLIILIALISYCYTIKAHFSKTLFVFLVVLTYISFVTEASNFLEARFFPNNFETYHSLEFSIINIFLLAVTFAPIRSLILQKIKPLIHIVHDDIWRRLWIIPLLFNLSNIILISSFSIKLISSWQFISVGIIMVIGAFAVYYIVLKMLFETYEIARLNANIRLLDKQVDLQLEHYKMLNEKIETTRMAKHDLRHHFLVIQDYLKKDSKESLLQYLNQYMVNLSEETSLTLCNNHTVDAIIRHYLAIAKANNILMDIALTIPSEISISNLDLCVLFGNCLENAIEACSRMFNEDKFIKIKTKLSQHTLSIIIDNSFNGQLKQADQTFLSTKRTSGEGVGLYSIRLVAKKYNGAAIFEADYEEKIFKTSIMLQI